MYPGSVAKKRGKSGRTEVAEWYKGRIQDGLGRVWESEFWAEKKGGSLNLRIQSELYIHILKS